MNFQDMVTEVLRMVKRPDKLLEAQTAVRNATLKAHTQDFYYKDILEVPIQFPTPGFITNFDPTLTIPRFRKPKYIRVWNYDPTDMNGGAEGIFIKWIDIENSLDAYGDKKTNVAYMAGMNIQIRSSMKLSHILFGAYLFPDVGTGDNIEATSFIAREQPMAIIYEAARRLFKSIGFDEQASEMNNLVQEEYAILRINSVGHPGE